MTSPVLLKAASWGCLFGVGDFFAQFYGAHKEAAKRRAAGEKRTGPRPSGKDMLGMLDLERLGYAFGFGLVAGPAALQCGRVGERIFGTLQGSAATCMSALGVQQIVLTPLLMWCYFNTMTMAHGGFTDTSFMDAYRPQQRHTAWSVEKYILGDVMPYPVVTSWAAFTPIYALNYCRAFRGRSALAWLFLLPWVASLSVVQHSELI